MGFQEKNTLVNIFSTILITVIYWPFMINWYQNSNLNESEIFQFWGRAFVLLVVVTIIAKIIITIIFTIINAIVTREYDDNPSFADERDQIIELKASRNSMVIFSMGVILGMIALAIGLQPVTLLISILIFGTLSDLLGEVSKFYFYRRGF